ncbi:MAG: D-alanyl-D-alanine carboxypeptidase family protein [Gammaproteobacteria bacterium]
MSRYINPAVVLFLFYIFIPGRSAATIVPAPPMIKASSYLVMDYYSHKMLVSENIDERVEPASLTKMMTVYVAAGELAAGNISLDDMVEVSEKAWRMPGSRMFIEVDKKVSVDNLLKGIIVQSGNDASVALAEHIAGSEDAFTDMMNHQAAGLGMTGSHFMNSTGLPHENHYTTARDMAILASALIRDHPEIYAYHSMKEFTFNGIKQHNRNRLLWNGDGVDGVKTGHTESAGFCLVASARRGNMRLISVVMGTDGEQARVRSSRSILNFGFRFYETHKLYNANETITTGKIWKGLTDSLDLGIVDDLYITIPRGKYKKLDASVELDSTIIAPVARGDVRGKLRVILEGKELVNKPLIALHSVAEGSLFNRLKDEVELFFE